MLPIAIGLGAADPSFRSPMSIAVIGGLFTSTVLSLLVVPVVFEIVDDTEHWLRRQVKRFRHPHEPRQPHEGGGPGGMRSAPDAQALDSRLRGE
jgi:hypothetical protein